MKHVLYLASGLLCVIACPVGGQSQSAHEAGLPLDFAGATSAQAASLVGHLQLGNGQIESLNRLYEEYISRRGQHEASLAQWQQELQQAQAPASFDEDRATRLLRDIADERQQVAADLLTTRERAGQKLTPIQRAQLQALADNNRARLRPDRYYQLLLMPTADIWRFPLASEPAPRKLMRRTPKRSKGVGRYGVYGGYSYGGPQYGVYGSYGQGPIGVHAGIGRGGPSIGIGIGGIFGGRWR